MPARASSCLIPADDHALDTPMDYESVPILGCALGSASVIVLDETVNTVWLVHKTSEFFKHESCGKCTPCREGTYWMERLSHRILTGNAVEADVDLLLNVAQQIQNKCLCPLGEFSIPAVLSSIQHFREDFSSRVRSADHG